MTIVNEGLGDGNLCVEFDIHHGSKDFKLVLTYPSVFPDAPPLVKTRDGTRISGHQYGDKGELCLEHRPENWNSDITGSEMIESAYKLLSSENVESSEEAQHVPDGHNVSLGQASRTADGRFVLTANDLEALNGLEENRIYNGEIGYIFQDRKESTRLMRVSSADTTVYTSKSKFSNFLMNTSKVFIIRKPAATIPTRPTPADLSACIEVAASPKFDTTFIKKRQNFFFLTCHDNSWTLYWVGFFKNIPFVHSYRTLLDTNTSPRLPKKLEALSQKTVGIVGCGSVGSKVAMHLIRSGVRVFLLIDDDVFFEGNLVRHTLLTSDIGFHKTTALHRKMLLVNPNANINTRQIRLGGQESSASTVSAIEQLSTCDLIVDATANPNAFTFCASISKRGNIPIVWGSVIAGGFGGVIARAVPNRDPEPLEAKQQVEGWRQARRNEDQASTSDGEAYIARSADGQTEIASDADVSIIASHLAHFAIDTLVNAEHSDYQNSAYAIGMSKNDIFSAPFDIKPIEYVEQREWTSSQPRESAEEAFEFLRNLILKEPESVT